MQKKNTKQNPKLFHNWLFLFWANFIVFDSELMLRVSYTSSNLKVYIFLTTPWCVVIPVQLSHLSPKRTLMTHEQHAHIMDLAGKFLQTTSSDIWTHRHFDVWQKTKATGGGAHVETRWDQDLTPVGPSFLLWHTVDMRRHEIEKNLLFYWLFATLKSTITEILDVRLIKWF